MRARTKDNKRERESTQTQLDLQWECQSDRSQVIAGGKLLIGQLASWVTWDLTKIPLEMNKKKKKKKKISFVMVVITESFNVIFNLGRG